METVYPHIGYYGIVKWFNRNTGYGFITYQPDPNELEIDDIFVHYTGINSPFEYKALMAGEIVTFRIAERKNEKSGETVRVAVDVVPAKAALTEDDFKTLVDSLEDLRTKMEIREKRGWFQRKDGPEELWKSVADYCVNDILSVEDVSIAREMLMKGGKEA